MAHPGENLLLGLLAKAFEVDEAVFGARLFELGERTDVEFAPQGAHFLGPKTLHFANAKESFGDLLLKFGEQRNLAVVEQTRHHPLDALVHRAELLQLSRFVQFGEINIERAQVPRATGKSLGIDPTVVEDLARECKTIEGINNLAAVHAHSCARLGST